MSLSRSEQMARIRARNTKPEKLLREALWARGLRYRIHHPTPAGRSDIVFPGQRLVIFVDGCFWHGCPDHYVRPTGRGEFWANKLTENVKRDQRQTRKLEELGWTVSRFWEHLIHTDLAGVVERVEVLLTGEWIAERQTEPRVWRVDPVPDSSDMETRLLVDLRDPTWHEQVTRKRSTKKW